MKTTKNEICPYCNQNWLEDFKKSVITIKFQPESIIICQKCSNRFILLREIKFPKN